MNRTRTSLYQKTIEQREELQNRKEEIRTQVRDITETKLSLEREQMRNVNLQALNHLAAQVSHDIQSPLAALEMLATHSFSALEDEKMLLRNAAGRIKDIAHLLLTRNKEYFTDSPDQGKASSLISSEIKSKARPCLLPSLIEGLLSEKRAEYRGKANVTFTLLLSEQGLGLFAHVHPAEFKRVLSNLINNAVEAIESQGEVTLLVEPKGDQVQIIVQDNGRGIPQDVLPRLMERGATFNKPKGSGLGLFHAKEAISAMGGQIQIESVIGKGTSIFLSLPSTTPPKWYVPEILISEVTQVVIIDDDSAIHQVWKQRLSEVFGQNDSLEIVYLFSPDQLKVFLQEGRGKKEYRTLFLCDYEFGRLDMNGIDLIQELGIVSESILVTSRYEESGIIERCEKMGLRVLPKGMAPSIPIRLFVAQEAR